MKALTLAAIALVSMTAPALAQTRNDEQRLDTAQRRFDQAQRTYEAELQLYRQSVEQYRSAAVRGPNNRLPYDDRAYYNDDRYENGYDAARYYREGPQYRERVLASDDRVYRGNDGRYYCQRSDGTTGLIIGAGAGGILGNVIDGGHSRTAGTLLGAVVGGLAGRALEQSSSQNQIRCR